MTINIFGIKFNIRKYELAVIIIILAVILALIGYKIQQGKGAVIIKRGEDMALEGVISSSECEDSVKGEENDNVDEIQIYVVGCVNNPGVVTLNKGQIINDAIRAAGGATREADIENINLVYKLYSNLMLNIRPKSEIPRQDGGEAGSGVLITEDSGDVIVAGDTNSDKVNLNTATIDRLQTLPGIGEVTAKDIISYREEIGGFNSIEDIMNIRGIKEGRFNNIKDLITVE